MLHVQTQLMASVFYEEAIEMAVGCHRCTVQGGSASLGGSIVLRPRSQASGGFILWPIFHPAHCELGLSHVETRTWFLRISYYEGFPSFDTGSGT